jgi:hypothetical protein
VCVIADRTVPAVTADSPGLHTAKEMNQVSDSLAAPATAVDAVDEPIPQPPSAELSSTAVLITEQEVVFSTAVARLVTIMRQMLATSTDASRPPRQHYPKRYEFLENNAMASEMERL